MTGQAALGFRKRYLLLREMLLGLGMPDLLTRRTACGAVRSRTPGCSRAAGEQDVYARPEMTASLLDTKSHISGTEIRFGADALLSLLPAVGPVASTAISAYLIWEARRLGISAGALLRMIGNIGMDALISAVPVAGSIGDVFSCQPPQPGPAAAAP